jgi:hypothetical protein
MSVEDFSEALKRQRAASQAGGRSWDDPTPLFADYEKPAPYPVDALPPVIRGAVQVYQAFAQQPVELIASSALGAVSLACQGLADVDRDGNLNGPCSLSFVSVASSGERKTACDRRMRRALEQWQEEKRQEQAPAIRAAERRLALWEARRDGLMSKVKRLSGSIKPEDEAEREQLESKVLLLESERPTVPPQVKLFHEDTTQEKLAVNLAAGWPSSSLWSDEAGLIVGSHAMSEDSALRFLALLNRLWDGGTFDRQREARNSAYVRGRRFTVSLMLQPSALAKLVSAGDGIARGVGALARFLLAWPSTTIGSRTYRSGDLGSSALVQFDARLRGLLDAPLPLDPDGALRPPALRLSSEAFEIWRQLHDDIEHQLGRRGEFSELPDFGAKAAEQAARIACVMHVFEHGPAGEIGPGAMLAGARLAIWHLAETRRIFATIGQAGEAADAQLLLEWLQDQAEAPTLRDILRLGPYRIRDKRRRDAAIAMLVDHGLARVEQRGQADHLVLNPKARS